MSDADRAAAREMIAESVAKNGQVDFKSLKSLQYTFSNIRRNPIRLGVSIRFV